MATPTGGARPADAALSRPAAGARVPDRDGRHERPAAPSGRGRGRRPLAGRRRDRACRHRDRPGVRHRHLRRDGGRKPDRRDRGAVGDDTRSPATHRLCPERPRGSGGPGAHRGVGNDRPVRCARAPAHRHLRVRRDPAALRLRARRRGDLLHGLRLRRGDRADARDRAGHLPRRRLDPGRPRGDLPARARRPRCVRPAAAHRGPGRRTGRGACHLRATARQRAAGVGRRTPQGR